MLMFGWKGLRDKESVCRINLTKYQLIQAGMSHNTSIVNKKTKKININEVNNKLKNSHTVLLAQN